MSFKLNIGSRYQLVSADSTIIVGPEDMRSTYIAAYHTGIIIICVHAWLNGISADGTVSTIITGIMQLMCAFLLFYAAESARCCMCTRGIRPDVSVCLDQTAYLTIRKTADFLSQYTLLFHKAVSGIDSGCRMNA